MRNKITLIYGDCLKRMDKLPAKSIDLIFTSPPYNVNKEYENWKDDKEYEYFIEESIGKLHRILKPAGRVVWNILGSITAKGRIYCPLLPSWNALHKNLKFRDFIIWNQMNSENDTAWGSWASASAPHFRHQCEILLVYFKEKWGKGKGKTDIPPKKFPEWTRDIWNVPTARKQRHPCPFSIQLAKRVVVMFSFVGDVVLDPFMGSGTTGVACKELSRYFIGIENNKEYYELAKKRIANTMGSMF